MWRYFLDIVKRYYVVVFFVFLFLRNYVGVGWFLVLNVYKKILLFFFKDRFCNSNEYIVRLDENILCWFCFIIILKIILYKGNVKFLKWFIVYWVLILSIKLDVCFKINFCNKFLVVILVNKIFKFLLLKIVNGY